MSGSGRARQLSPLSDRCPSAWNAHAEPATGRQRSTNGLQGRTVSIVENPPVDIDAFEAARREEKAVADERCFGVITDRVVVPLLAAASVGVGARVLDVATGPGVVAAARRHAARRLRLIALLLASWSDSAQKQYARDPHQQRRADGRDYRHLL
jgi:hypothetical protein